MKKDRTNSQTTEPKKIEPEIKVLLDYLENAAIRIKDSMRNINEGHIFSARKCIRDAQFYIENANDVYDSADDEEEDE